MREQLFARYRNLITGIVSVDHRARENVEQYKAKLLLADGSNLRVSEVFIDGDLVKYSYYWLDESDQIIAGWDNAAHHPEIKTHPHHVHTSASVNESPIRNLDDVLALLARKIK
ncbi:MAG: hypothetical protein FJ009_17870 [Chloroflexi bacterium]|nr:hypothetical protein [Chloroflexota bacterium]